MTFTCCTLFVFFSFAVKCSLAVANILDGNRCAELKVANPAREMRHSQRGLSRNFLSVTVLNKLAKIFHFYAALVTRATTEQQRAMLHAQRAPFLVAAATRNSVRHGIRRRITAVPSTEQQICKSHTNRRCTPVPCRILKVELVETFLQTSANHSRPLPSRPSVTEILPRRDEFQAKMPRENGKRGKLGKEMSRGLGTYFVTEHEFSRETSRPVFLPRELTRTFALLAPLPAEQKQPISVVSGRSVTGNERLVLCLFPISVQVAGRANSGRRLFVLRIYIHIYV